MSAPENKSYLSAGINAITPWGSRQTTPRPPQPSENQKSKPPQPETPGLASTKGNDHSVSHRHRLSLRNYPKDCPTLAVQWYHAVDVPKRKPFGGDKSTDNTKPSPRPKKWQTFSTGDSRAIEAAFQKIAEEEEAAEHAAKQQDGRNSPPASGSPRSDQSPKMDGSDGEERITKKVPVNEDFLFDVDIEKRELAPAYWPGPVYEVRRGTWFFPDSSALRPCDENLAMQLEEGYVRLRPWKFPQPKPKRSASQPRSSRPTSVKDPEELKNAVKQTGSNPLTPKTSSDNLKGEKNEEATSSESAAISTTPQNKTYRLFGSYMNHVVTYENSTTAWLQKEDDLISRLGSTMYQRFAGGAHYAGQKISRGYSDISKKPETKDGKDGKDDSKKPITGPLGEGDTSDGTQTPTKATTGQVQVPSVEAPNHDDRPQSPTDLRKADIERQMSNIVASVRSEDPEKQEEGVRKRDEQEIRDDYKEQEGDEQGREIEHLLLVTHGIGQRLGLRMESVNFIHDVNSLRKTLKAVYANSQDLQALNNELDKIPKNCRVQVLPICWRHLLDFPKQSLRHNRKEHDLGDLDFEDLEYPNLDEISVEGVPSVRNLLTDLALDVLLYQSPAYKPHITRIVLQECNRIYKLFKDRNPMFNGKVSLVGHSLGSAIMFDILCQQKASNVQSKRRSMLVDKDLKLDFEVEDFYALGSPIGLFQMLKGRRIAARHSLNFAPAETPGEITDDPFLAAESSWARSQADIHHMEITTSSPKCQRLFNIFHPTDPISYRLEPLISPAMKALKPQLLPYTKRGIFTPVGQGFAGIGAKVSQSVSGLWTNLYSGVASSLLNRSLGLTAEEAGKLGNPIPNQSRSALEVGAGTNIGAGVIPPGPIKEAVVDEKLDPKNVTRGEDGQHPPTLIDTEIETLFSGFQKGRKNEQGEPDAKDIERAQEWEELEEKSKRLRREEAKVRALNSNGRVDYSIQEGAFDISILASIASHLSYWADEDVSHFMISQLLARHRVIKRATSNKELKK